MTIKNNIPKKHPGSSLSGLFWFLLFGVFFTELLTYTWIRTESTQMTMRISKQQETMAKNRAYQNALLVERDRLKSDDRITRIAKTQLNLTTEISLQTIYLDGDNR